MRKILVIVSAVLVLLAGGAATAAWRYDAGRNDMLAEGITLAGVDVGGLKVAAARAALEREIAGPLSEPIVVGYRNGQFVFSPRDADVRTNVDALLATALAKSRDGNFLTRALRDVTGGRLGTRLSLDVTYSSKSVGRFARQIKRDVDRPAREATSSASFVGVRIRPSKTGIAVQRDALERQIAALLVDPDAVRSFELPTRVVRPKVTTRKLERKFRYFVAVSRGRKVLRLFVGEKLAKTYRVAIGRIGYDTPAGLYEIRTKAVNPSWFVPNKPWAGELAGKVIPPGDPDNPIKARWMGFWDGAGIHGTAESSSIGTAASHGCIRMTVPDVIELYDRVPLHTPLYIS